MYDEKAADRAVKFITTLKHTKGKWAGKRFDLLDWQEKIIRDIFGTLKEDGTRQYKTAYIEVSKKNGKSELAAAIALYLLFADREPGAEVYSCAGDREQASIVYHVATGMVRQVKQLEDRCKIVDSQKRILAPKTSSFYRVLSAEAYTKHGFSPHGVIFDELHTQPSRELWDVMTVGTGAAREQQLIVAITTAGYDRKSICWEVHEYARKVRDGVIEDPSFYPVIYSVAEDADWEDEENWYKANPSLGSILKIEDMRAEFLRAKENPAQQNAFRRLRLNQWTTQDTRYIPMDKWAACSQPTPDLEGRVCWAGLDLANTTDITAFVMLFKVDDIYHILPRFYIPEERIGERVQKDRVPYDAWVRDGHVIATPGDILSYSHVEQDIDELGKKYNIKGIAFDRWGAVQMAQNLEGLGFQMVQFGQGYRSMAAPTKELMTQILSRGLNHGGNPVLTWMADNLAVTQDPAGNVKPAKDKSTEKIDGMVALIMALDMWIRQAVETNPYEAGDIFFIG